MTASSSSAAAAVGAKKQQKAADWSAGEGVLPGRAVLGPLLLMITTPCFSIIFFYVCTEMQGNFVAFGRKCWQETQDDGSSLVQVLRNIWPDPWDVTAWKMIFAFMSFQLALMKLVPGKRFEATLTPKGNRPVYKANGVACYLITLATLLLLAQFEIFVSCCHLIYCTVLSLSFGISHLAFSNFYLIILGPGLGL
jgi:7-dehydrocholesterol reductase